MNLTRSLLITERIEEAATSSIQSFRSFKKNLLMSWSRTYTEIVSDSYCRICLNEDKQINNDIASEGNCHIAIEQPIVLCSTDFGCYVFSVTFHSKMIICL